MTKAPLGGAETGANPTDRGKKGTKRSILTEGKGIPLSVAVDGANRHDKMLVKGTLDNIIIERSLHKVIQNICMDKGYDFPDIRELVEEYGYTAHIRKRGEENIGMKEIPDYRARGCGAKNLALLQNQCKSSQLGKLILLITGIMAHKGKNYGTKLRKYYFCTTTS